MRFDWLTEEHPARGGPVSGDIIARKEFLFGPGF